MGAIKNKSDQNIIDNDKELVTPLKVREVNDVIDAQVEAAKTSISTLEQNVTTLGSGVIPNGGTTGQMLVKNSNTDRDTTWADPPNGGGGGFLPLTGGTVTGDINLNARIIDTHSDGYYNNNLIFFDPDAEDDTFYFSTHLQYTSDQSSKFSPRSLVDKGYVDTKVQSYLPLSGGQMGSTAKVFKSGGLEINFEHNTINGINTLRGNIFDLDMSAGYVDNADLKYRADYSANYTARSIVDKGYVDSKDAKVYKTTVEHDVNGGSTQTITHNLNTTFPLNVSIKKGGSDLPHTDWRYIDANTIEITGLTQHSAATLYNVSVLVIAY